MRPSYTLLSVFNNYKMTFKYFTQPYKTAYNLQDNWTFLHKDI